MLVPDNPLFGPPPSEVTPNDRDNAKAVIFKRRNAFSYVRPPYSSSAAHPTGLRQSLVSGSKLTSLPLIDVDYLEPY